MLELKQLGVWLLDEVKGDKIEVVSGNGISGEIRGDYKYVQGQFGEALEFNGQDTLVLFENEDPAQAFVLHRDKDVSLVFWVKPFLVSSIKPSSGHGVMSSMQIDSISIQAVAQPLVSIIGK